MSDRFSWQPWALPFWLFLLGLVFAAGLVFFAWHYSLASLQQDIAKQADLVRDDFNRRISAIDEISANSAIFVNSTLLLDGDEFRIFAEHIFNRYSFFVSMGYFPRVSAGERAFFEQERRDKGFPLFSISSRSERLLQPAPALASHFPLLYYEPFEPTNAALIGYDLAGDTAFSGVVDKAVVKNEAVFVYDSLVTLPGSLWCFKAVYAGKNVPEAPELRRNAAYGVIALRIDPLKLVESLEGVDTFVLSLQIESESGVQEVKSPRINEENPGMLRRIFFPLFSRDYFIQFHGQRYTLQLKRPLRPKDVDYAVTVLALCAGLIIVLLLGLTGIVASRRALEARQRNELIHKEVAEKTAELSVKNMQLRREVEERLEVEQALAASEYRFRELFDRMSNGVAVYQADGPEGNDFVGIDFNRAAWEIDRKGKDELVGRTVREIFPVFGENVLLPVIRRVWATGVAEEIPETIFNCNGMNCWRKYNVYRLPAGEVVVLCSDITERVRIEEELRQAHKMEAIGTLAGGIAHDFNNILSAILGYAEVARMSIQTDTHLVEYLDHVIRASHRARDLVRQILTFSRKERQAQEVLQPHLIIKESLKLLRASLPATIEIKEDIDPQCGLVEANPTQVQQVIVNLCTNALHAMEGKHGTLSVKLSQKVLNGNDAEIDPGMAPGDYIELVVADTGHGMEKSVMERIFDPFFTTKEVGKGTGMGLSVVHGIVRACGGMIRVESEPGKGATIRVYLPAVKDRILGPRIRKPEAMPTGSERILVVDDEASIVGSLGEILSHLGYRVTGKTDSREALDLFRKNPDDFDLVISDQTMPFLTGVELSAELLRRKPDISIILCTGYSENINEEQARKAGIKAFVLKPVDYATLSRLVRSVLEGK